MGSKIGSGKNVPASLRGAYQGRRTSSSALNGDGEVRRSTLVFSELSSRVLNADRGSLGFRLAAYASEFWAGSYLRRRNT